MTVATKLRYWLLKTEPEVFSIDDLKASQDFTTCWDGVRNYQARNFMRDQMHLDDRVLVYHSNSAPSAVVGTARVCKTAYPDFTSWDCKDAHFDPKSKPENPTWFMVDIRFESKFSVPQSLFELKQIPKLEGMELLRKGSRLSVQPVTKRQFDIILNLGKPM